MALLTQVYTNTSSNVDIHATTLVGTFTNTTRIRKLYVNIFLDQVAGNGDYKASLTVQRAGAGDFYQSIITTLSLASGVTAGFFTSIPITLNATDVMKVYVLGLAGDTTTPDIIIDVNEEWISIDASGRVDVGAVLGTAQTALDVSAAVTQLINALAPVTATVNDAGASTTVFVTTLGSAVNDFYKGEAIIFTSGVLAGQLGQIKSYNGGTKAVTLQSALTSAPANGVSFVVATVAASRKFADFLATAMGTDNKVLLSADAQTGVTIPTTTTVTNTVSANLVQILGAAITGTAAQIVAAFTKFFDKAAPTGTVNSLPDAVAGAAGGVAIVGSSMGSVTGVSGNVTGNVTGSVGSLATQAKADAADAVWDEAIAGHLNPGSTGLALNTAGAAADPLANPVPGTYASGTAGAAIGTILTGRITVVSPMSQDGLVVKLVRGDDYLNADGRSLTWTDNGSDWPNLTGATVRFKWGIFSKICTVIGAGGAHQQVSLDLTSAETRVLEDGTFNLEATLANTHIVTIVVDGDLIIRQDI